MNYLHTKSPCCRGRIIKFGSRRRQCTICHKTWRVWKKRRGRKRKRRSFSLFIKYLNRQTPSLYSLARIQTRKSEDQLQRELRYGLKRYVEKTPWVKVPDKTPLIAIADAMMITISKKIYTFYFILLRPVNKDRAVIIEPFIKERTESKTGWKEAFNQLPSDNLNSILALVSDGHMGLVGLAKENKWLVQKCPFHIIAKIQGRRSRWVKSRHREMGEHLYSLLKNILTNPDEELVLISIKGLSDIRDTIVNLRLK